MEEMNELKMFTVSEANKLLTRLIPLIKEIQEKRNRILALEVEIDAMELVEEKSAESGYSPGLSRRIEEYNRSVSRFYSAIDEIHETGCFLKDVTIGLIDFYSLYEGRVVYLCWKLGEPEVSHWHEVGLGYGQRQPLKFAK